MQVTLNQPAAAASVPCSKLFDAATSFKLGALSQCTSADSVLTILLIGDVKLAPGDDLTLAAGQAQLVAALGVPPPAFVGNMTTGVESCGAACPEPTAVLQVRVGWGAAAAACWYLLLAHPESPHCFSNPTAFMHGFALAPCFTLRLALPLRPCARTYAQTHTQSHTQSHTHTLTGPAHHHRALPWHQCHGQRGLWRWTLC